MNDMQNHIKLFTGNANRPLAEKIASRVGIPLSAANVTRFPDGEISVTYEETVRGRDVFIIQSTGMLPNEYLMELLIMTDAARRASARRITAVMPFFAYARQDRKDRSRVPISAKLVANLLVAAGVDRVLTIDLHSPQIQAFFDIPVDHLYAAPLLVRYLREKMPPDNCVVVAPDPGGLKMAHSYSQLLNAGLALAGKHRISPTEVEALELVGDVEGKDCVLADDITTTAGTLCAAARMAKDNGAKSVRAAVSHCPITELGIQRLKESPIEELITTDSLPPQSWNNFPITVLSVADLLGDAIKRIYGDESVSKLFEIHQGRTQ
ncbi:MAG: ribose-phosphate pyrophosphokinase [Kiritimatiellae bacterium]|nr:ribose-phosphate pyrophosphokinase [Kiritimatiellia bacterium]